MGRGKSLVAQPARGGRRRPSPAESEPNVEHIRQQGPCLTMVLAGLPTLRFRATEELAPERARTEACSS